VRQVEKTFEGVAGNVSAARHFVSATLDEEGAGDVAWAAVQIVSELATNAVVHAATPFTVTVLVDVGLVRIAVTDAKPFAVATQRHFSDYTTTGRGLRLVERMSRSWGVDTSQSIKTVWCEIVRATSGGELEPSSRPELRGTAENGATLPTPASSSENDGVTPTVEALALRLTA
jgi:anti-sigma regulatory factor (Ser/Thr protein kinase)